MALALGVLGSGTLTVGSPFGIAADALRGVAGAAVAIPAALPWPSLAIVFFAMVALAAILGGAMTRAHGEARKREAVLHEAQEQLQTALARAEAAVEMRDRLLANVSHDLRTPLNVIVGYSHMLLDGHEDVGAMIAHVAPRLRDHAVSLTALVSELLNLSRVSCGKVTLMFSDIDVRELLEEAARGARALLAGKPVEVVVDCNVATLRSDRVRLLQILNNLASNAATFTTEGRIVLTARAQRDWVGFYVSDSGCGIPTAKQDVVFSAFEQVTPDTAGGIGLGLAIVRQLTELLGGTVTLTSAPNVGSSFAVTIPSQSTNRSRVIVAAGARRATPPGSAAGKLELLLGGKGAVGRITPLIGYDGAREQSQSVTSAVSPPRERERSQVRG